MNGKSAPGRHRTLDTESLVSRIDGRCKQTPLGVVEVLGPPSPSNTTYLV